jgi:hypothetical protein
MDVSETPDFRTLDDPAFLAERRHVRDQLEHKPAGSAGLDQLAELYAAMNDEFCRRARIAWTEEPAPLSALRIRRRAQGRAVFPTC